MAIPAYQAVSKRHSRVAKANPSFPRNRPCQNPNFGARKASPSFPRPSVIPVTPPSFPYPPRHSRNPPVIPVTPPSFPRNRPCQPPLPLGEGGRRPGEGPQSPCYIRPLPLGPAHLPRGALTPTLSQRERGSEARARALQTRPTPLPLGEGGRRPGEGPQHPATSVRCRWDRPTCHEVPSPQPSPRGRGGRRLPPGRYKQDQPLSLWERVAEGRVRVPNTLLHPSVAVGTGPLATRSPHPGPLPEGEGVGGWGQGATNKTNPLSLWERVAEGRVRVPNHPATSVRCRWDRPTCHEVPSPQPSPRGRGGRRACPPRPNIGRPISRGQSATSPRGRSCRSSRDCLPGRGRNRAGRRSPGLRGP